MDEFIAVNRRNYQRYLDRLACIAGIKVIHCPAQETSNYQYVSVRIDESLSGISRDDIFRVYMRETVLLHRYIYQGCHRMQLCRSLYPDAGESRKPVQ